MEIELVEKRERKRERERNKEKARETWRPEKRGREFDRWLIGGDQDRDGERDRKSVV